MGNSCGDLAEYWELIYNNEQMMGGFVWEWADHAIRGERGFLYGGDFGEREHDGNFCCDGLLTTDRRIKSTALEMKAVYGGKTSSGVKSVQIPISEKDSYSTLQIEANPYTGELVSIKRNGIELLKTNIRLNIMRYTDNDRFLMDHWVGKCHLDECHPHILSCEKGDNSYRFTGVLAANCLMPAVHFELAYTVNGSELAVDLAYKLTDYVKRFPRFGIEFGVDKKYGKFTYIGYGSTESYVDKHIAAEYGYHEGTPETNYDRNYVRPQESGSHYHSVYLSLSGLFDLEADHPFSFSVNPYTTEQLVNTAHDFELAENDFVNVCLDVAMRGVGSNSCGPELADRYEIPREGKNSFKLKF